MIKKLKFINNNKLEKNMEKYSKKVLKKVSKHNNGIIVIPKCKSIEEKKWVSTYISVHFSFENKKVLLIVTDTENTNNKEQYNINMLWNAIKKTDTKNLDVLIITPSQFENNKFETIINLIKEKYDSIIIDEPFYNRNKKNLKQMNLVINKQSKQLIKKEKVIAFLNKKIGNDQKLENVIKKHIDRKENKYEKLSNDNLNKITQEFNSIKELLNSMSNEIHEKAKKEFEFKINQMYNNLKEEINEMQKNMKKEIIQDVIITQEEMNEVKLNIQKEIQEKVESMQERIKADTEKEINKIEENAKKEIHLIQREIKKNTDRKINKIQEETRINVNNIQESIRNKAINMTKDSFSFNERITYEDLEKTASYIIPIDNKLPMKYNFDMEYIGKKYIDNNKKEKINK